MPTDNSSFSQAPAGLTVSGSIDGTNYNVLYTNVGGTNWTFVDYPDTSSAANQKASLHRNKAKEFAFSQIGDYFYYKLEVFSTVAPFSYTGASAGHWRLSISQASFEIEQVNQVSS